MKTIFIHLFAALGIAGLMIASCGQKTPIEPPDQVQAESYRPLGFKGVLESADSGDSLFYVTRKSDNVTVGIQAVTATDLDTTIYLTKDSKTDTCLLYQVTDTATCSLKVDVYTLDVKKRFGPLHVRLTWSHPAEFTSDPALMDSLWEYYVYGGLDPDLEMIDSIGATRAILNDATGLVATPPDTFVYHIDVIPKVEEDVYYYYAVAARKLNRYEGEKVLLDAPIKIPTDTLEVYNLPTP